MARSQRALQSSPPDTQAGRAAPGICLTSPGSFRQRSAAAALLQGAQQQQDAGRRPHPPPALRAAVPGPRLLSTTPAAHQPAPPPPQPQQEHQRGTTSDSTLGADSGVNAPGSISSNSSSGSSNGSGSSPQAAASSSAHPVYNLPNAVSAARLVSGPVIAVWLLQGHYEAATVALAISGASDWLDGFLARRMGASSVFGSYLDPVADKVLIACVAGALLQNGDMPVWLAVVVVGRDALLVAGAFAFRFRGFGWRWPGREAFFRTADASPPPGPGPAATTAGGAATVGGAGGDAGGGPGVSYMKPLLISKANTVLQLVLLGGYLTRGMYGWPEGAPVAALELATAATTVASLAAYGSMALQGRLFK
ncbi:putative cardiolipin synthase 1 [Tetrabaena socialis]|uniref:Putative cardiolipin synthase 1 n=1 Tax=Tetrabaena socialis TaxID=47790 RepID=A0A2J7ZX80_9CHLO|nr:putative cardiolipin synthase 1 [Tetrabaena socialis]|eukprot:PNH04862.1 putative cardiolipin synthase 1 [Tetrabaena socialis]